MYLHILEFIGMAFSMLGAFYLSRDSEKDPRHMEKAFGSFMISNTAMITFSAGMLMIPLLIQMILFMTTAYNGLLKYRPEFKKWLYIVPTITAVISMFVFFNYLSNGLNLKITYVEVLASLAAVYGSHISKEINYIKRMSSFILFFIADILFIYIAYDKGLLFFGIQSTFFVYTSVAGMLNTYKNKEKLSLGIA